MTTPTGDSSNAAEVQEGSVCGGSAAVPRGDVGGNVAGGVLPEVPARGLDEARMTPTDPRAPSLGEIADLLESCLNKCGCADCKREDEPWIAAASHLREIAGVLANPLLDFALGYVAQERWVDLHNAQINVAEWKDPNDLREQVEQLRARLRTILSSPTAQEGA